MEKYKKTGRGIALAALLSVVLGVVGCATNGLDVGEEVIVGRTTFSDNLTNQYMVFPEYRIAPGDLLDVLYQVKSWVRQPSFQIAVDHKLNVRFVDHPELNEMQYVRPDGKISLAYLGSVDVVGKTVEELTAELKDRYQKHLKNVELYIVVEDFRSAIKELKQDLKTAPRGLSRLATVRPDGYATFAMLGDIYVADKTVPEIRDVLNANYEEIIPGLSCDLFLERHAGSKISIFGEVNDPGSYQILRPVSVFEALSMAGSITSAARMDSIIIFRQKKDKVVATRLDLKQLMHPRMYEENDSQHEPELYDDETEEAFATLLNDEKEDARQIATAEMFYLHPDDIIYVSRRRLNSAAQIMREVGDVLLFNGWSVSFRDNFNLMNEDQ